MPRETTEERRFRDIATSARILGTPNRPGLPEEQPGIDIGNVRATIAYAIANDYKIDMFYADDVGGEIVLAGYRAVIPVAIGSHITSGNQVFRAYLSEGVSKSKRMPKWRLFRLDRVRSIRIHFSPSRAKWHVDFRPGDKHIGNMFKEVTRDKRSVQRAKIRRKRQGQ